MADSKIFEDGGPAAPCSNEQFTHGNPSVGEAWSGMSLRDWFAGQALTGMVSGAHGDETSMAGLLTAAEEAGVSTHSLVAQAAYNYADAMIAARKGGA